MSNKNRVWVLSPVRLLGKAEQQWQCCPCDRPRHPLHNWAAGKAWASPSGDCGAPLSKRPWNTLYNEKASVTVTAEEEKNRLWHSFNCAPVPVTARRPGSFSVERAQSGLWQLLTQEETIRCATSSSAWLITQNTSSCTIGQAGLSLPKSYVMIT